MNGVHMQGYDDPWLQSVHAESFNFVDLDPAKPYSFLAEEFKIVLSDGVIIGNGNSSADGITRHNRQ